MSISVDRILFEDEHLLAVNKLSDELVVKGAGKVDKLPLLDFLSKDYPGLRALHRLDFETSGVVLFAKTRAAHEAVRASNFAGWQKTYRAVVAGPLEHGADSIRVPLPARGTLRKKKGKDTPKEDLVPAVTHYKVLERFGNATDVECRIETGRHHQIRRHMAMIGHPLVLDRVYGHGRFNQMFSHKFRYYRFFLHALSLDIPHPITGQPLHIEAELPRPYLEVLKKLRTMPK